MNVVSDKLIKVFAHDSDYGKMYSTGISKKDKNDNWKTSYITIYFGKGVEVADGTNIQIEESWLIPTNDSKRVALFINKFKTSDEIVDNARKSYEESKEESDESFDDFSGKVEIDDDDLPF